MVFLVFRYFMEKSFCSPQKFQRLLDGCFLLVIEPKLRFIVISLLSYQVHWVWWYNDWLKVFLKLGWGLNIIWDNLSCYLQLNKERILKLKNLGWLQYQFYCILFYFFSFICFEVHFYFNRIHLCFLWLFYFQNVIFSILLLKALMKQVQIKLCQILFNLIHKYN